MDTADLIPLIESYGLMPHLHADDTQVYGSCPPADVVVQAFSAKLAACSSAVAS